MRRRPVPAHPEKQGGDQEELGHEYNQRLLTSRGATGSNTHGES
ncbi:MAG TPA: hypothetical protein VK424_05545 [Thermoplasmata archaeon]|nr:hypothetical protein [Thermoplasmata archaeon]